MSKKKWESGKQSEIDFWSTWLGTEGAEWKKEFTDRLDVNLPFQDYLVKYLPKSPKCIILDVGAGPLSLLGKMLPGYELDIYAVDSLASEYDKILKHHNISPVVRTQYCEVERLSEKFPSDYFDLIHVRNALDHSYDPLEGIRQMLRVLKVNCFIFMSHYSNEAEKGNYIGFHQWNFCREGSRFIIWNRTNKIDVSEALGNHAEVSIEGDEYSNIVEIRKANG